MQYLIALLFAPGLILAPSRKSFPSSPSVYSFLPSVVRLVLSSMLVLVLQEAVLLSFKVVLL